VDLAATPTKASFHSDTTAAPPSCPTCAPIDLGAPTVKPTFEACPVDVTRRVAVSRGPIHHTGTPNRFIQQVRITNISHETLDRTISLALDSLAPGVTALHPDDVTTCAQPAGSPVFDVEVRHLRPRQSAVVTILFSTAIQHPITYTPRVLATDDERRGGQDDHDKPRRVDP
jgi:hypothetical protein